MTATTLVADAQSRRSSRLLTALRTAAVVLAVVGIFGAVMRAAIVGLTLATPLNERPELSAYDAQATDLWLTATGLEPGSAEYERTRRDVVELGAKFVDSPGYTFAHMLPGILILLLAPVQFSADIRRRHVRIHRWSGRLILVMVILATITAFYFGVIKTSAPPFERPTIIFFSALFFFAAARAFVAIRVGDVRRHREWMIRMLAMALGIGTVRVVSLPVVFLLGARWETTFVVSMWIGWLLTLGVAELWIRHTRGTPLAGLSSRRSVAAGNASVGI